MALATGEAERLAAASAGTQPWLRWGPYLSERAWGTVREDYSATGDAWDFLPHEHARSKAYRWGEDGIGGISDSAQYLCFALALWNGADPILKERCFGLSGPQGNHGENVKDYYYYLDSTPTHSYMKLLYKYPQQAFPYAWLVEENQRCGFGDFEFELLDTGIFAENRYFDVLIEYAKATPDDLLIRISVCNRGDQPAPLTLLPTLWFRNTWAWGYPAGPMADVSKKPRLHPGEHGELVAEHPVLGTYRLYSSGSTELIFTDNDTNTERLYGVASPTPYVKDSFHRYIVAGEQAAVNPAHTGTKAAPVFRLTVGAGDTTQVVLRLCATPQDAPFATADELFAQRIAEADAFYAAVAAPMLDDDAKLVQRQALAGMLWSKQLFYYDVEQWLAGDPLAAPPAQRWHGRNADWKHLNNFDIISMPDKWEYPWYAGWDLAFHCIPLAMGIRLAEGKGDSPVSHSTFDGYPDLTEAKADAHVIAIKPALQHENVTLLPNRMVWKLATDASGRSVTAVHVRHAGAEEVYRADLVIVAAGAANSAAIFLRSANDKHPDGLANSSGMVGRNYICHNNGTFLAISKEPNDSIFQKTLAMSDWYEPSADWEYPMGLIQMLGKVDATLMAFESPQPLGTMTYAEMAAHSLDFWLQSEDLPDPQNRITLNSAGEIELHYTANNSAAYERLVARLHSLLDQIGCHQHLIPVDSYLGTRFPFNLAHQAGTLRFGTDPATSVLDLHCKPHELDNVYVTDASFMPSVGAVNPSLTIIANTLRVADHLKQHVLR